MSDGKRDDEPEHLQCWTCAGHGQVGHLIPDECRTCDGKGWVVRYKSGVLAKWQGGPLLGRTPSPIPSTSR